MESIQRLKEFLDAKVAEFNQPGFIKEDPISVPHRFSLKQDQEITGLWTALISWGQRKTILNSATKLIHWMENEPYRFMIGHREIERKPFLKFVHRTFNGEDACMLIEFFRRYYQDHESLEWAFSHGLAENEVHVENALIHFRKTFENYVPEASRTLKHISSPTTGSRCKRLLMFLRWMVRKDHLGVDFGIWQRISPDQLLIPLDVHVERTARALGLLTRKPIDWKAVLELTENCRQLDPADPVKYDFALFGLGIEQNAQKRMLVQKKA